MPIFSHEKIALELSGGKDSVACLFYMRPYLPWITVYWLNTGDAYPETVEVIDECRKLCPNFVEVHSDVRAWQRVNGAPSDVVPITGECVHLPPKAKEIPCVDAYVCCANNIMLPLHERVVADGNTLIIRGQRNSDEHRGPLKSGDWAGDIQVFYPIEDWTDAEVLDYLKAEGAPIHPIYTHSDHGVDCLHCTGWWGKTNLPFLKRHPAAYRHVTMARGIIARMTNERMSQC